MKVSNRVVEWTLLATAAAALLPATLAAQGHGRGGGHGHVPPGHMPPPGMCRVWYDGVRPGHQPAPTNCRAAERKAYHTRGRVIYGAVVYRERRAHRHDSRVRYCDEWDRRRGECIYYPDDRHSHRRDYPAALPEMTLAIIFGRGHAVVEVRRWVAVSQPRARIVDADRDGRPEMVTWHDDRSRVVQRWFDDDRDGRADRVAFYDGERVVRMIR